MTRPAIVVTARRVLRGSPNVIQVVPLTRTLRDSGAEVLIPPDDDNGLDTPSAVQCQHVRSVAVARVTGQRGNIGPVTLGQVRNTLALLLDL
ncbi:type II toxin-antitoxin system PemK/MazF family toxin [Pseudactinotalea sp. Z1732]